VSTTEFEEDVVGGPPRRRYWQVRQRPLPSFEDDIDSGPLGGCCRRVRQHPPPSLKTMSMVGSLGALSARLAASTTELQDDVDGGPPMGTVGVSDSVRHRV
jgi:hypothetical protein